MKSNLKLQASHFAAAAAVWLLAASLASGADSVTFSSGVTGKQVKVTFTYQSGSGATGTFVNPNDFWVADSAGGSITITDIDPEPSDPCQIFADLDMVGGYSVYQGINSHMGKYSESEDVLDTFVSSDPGTHVTIGAGHALVIGLGHNAPIVSGGSHWAKAYYILTVMPSAPTPDTDGYWFRPAWCGNYSRTWNYNTADVDLAVFPDLAALEGSPDEEALTTILQSAFDWDLTYYNQYNHVYTAGGWDTYGATEARLTGQAFLWLCENHTDEEKLVLAVPLIQLGLDLSGMFDKGELAHGIPPLNPDSEWAELGKGAPWQGQGGHVQGRFLPVLAAGRCLNDATALDQLSKSGDAYLTYPYPAGAIGFGEASQVYVLDGPETSLTIAQRNARQQYGADVWGPPYLYTTGIRTLAGADMYTPHSHYNLVTMVGTATFTQGSANVTGSGTSWTTAVNGYQIMCRADLTGVYPLTDGYQMLRKDGRAYTIQSVSDTTHLTLTTPWLGDSGEYLYGIAQFVFIDRGYDANPVAMRDYNDPGSDDIGMPMFTQAGRRYAITAGLDFPRVYEDLSGCSRVFATLGVLMTDSLAVGGWNDMIDYTDMWMWLVGDNDVPTYWDEWARTLYNEYRSDYTEQRAVWVPCIANAGPDQSVLWEHKDEIQLDASASRCLVGERTGDPVYVWKEGDRTVATGKIPDPISLDIGTHVITLTQTTQWTDRMASPPVHRNEVQTDDVAIRVRPQVKFLVRKKVE